MRHGADQTHRYMSPQPKHRNKHTLYVDLEQNTENYSNPQQGIHNPESSHSDVCDRSDKISNPSTSQFVYFDYCAFSRIIEPVVKLEIGKDHIHIHYCVHKNAK